MDKKEIEQKLEEERDLTYEEIHHFFHNTIRELIHNLHPVLSATDMESEIMDTLGRIVADWQNKENVRKSIMVLAAMFLEMGKNSERQKTDNEQTAPQQNDDK